ncbi:MAG: DNA recombination protein RmuC [Vulcanimicrobiaceae bacterium]
MTATSDLIALAVLLIGVVITWLVREREVSMLRAVAGEEKARSGELVAQLTRADSGLAESQAALSAAQARLDAERQSFARERAGIEEKMLGQFQGVAQQALKGVESSFLELATARLDAEREKMTGCLTTRVEEIKGVLGPVRDEFAKFGQAVNSLQKHSAEDLGALKNGLQQVVQLQTSLQEAVRTTNDATGQLRNALQNPRVAGNWGEISLDRIVELAGMTEHCDFDRQTGVRSLDGTGERPDLTVHLTGGLHIPVDAKASVVNYIRAASEPDEEERKRLLRQSALDLESRVTELRGRGYDRIEGYAGMTFLFVPNEAMLSSAVTQKPSLIEEALRDKIVLCSPLLFICYLRAFANGWRIQQQEEKAEEVARRGAMLYNRLQTFFTTLGKVGRYLNHTVEKYNECVGKMDNLLVPGRELGKLLSANGELRAVSSVDTGIRDIRVPEDTDGELSLA